MKEENELSGDVTYVEDKLGISNKYRKVLGINWDYNCQLRKEIFLKSVLLSSIHWD